MSGKDRSNEVCSGRADPGHDVVYGVHTGPRRRRQRAHLRGGLRQTKSLCRRPPQLRWPSWKYEIVNAPLRTIVRVAHQVQDYQIVEAPGWIATERFDILATTPAVVPAERAEMLRDLLADRFNLRTHVERREMPIFEMVLTQPDGRLGPSARATSVNCADRAAARNGAPQRRPRPPEPGSIDRCAA